MNFYRRRPLALALSLCMLVSAAAALLPGIIPKLVLLGVALAGCALTCVLLTQREIDLVGGLERRAFFIMTAVLCTLMVAGSILFYDLHAGKYKRTDTVCVSGTVIETKYSASYSSTYVVRLHSIGDERVNAKGLMGTEDSFGLRAGDTFSATVTFVALDEFYEAYDVRRTEILADGCVFACRTAEQAKKIGERIDIEVLAARLRETFSAKVGLYLNDEMSALADALLLGDRENLGRIWRDIRYAGGLHLLALSGMHLMILSNALMRLMDRAHLPFHVKNGVIVGSVCLYIALICFPLSAVRAGIMLMLAYAAPYANAQSDRVTSLFLAGTVIMLLDPTAVFDKSFTLSFAATLGVILMSDAASRVIGGGLDRKKPAYKIIRAVCEGVYMSLGATMFIMPLQWVYFGETSVLSLLSTFILSPLIECMLLLLWPFLIFSLAGLHFLCIPLAWLLSLLGEGVTVLCEWMASTSPMVSLRYPFFPFILLGCIAVIAYMFFDRRYHWLHALIPFCAASVLFFCCIFVYHVIHSGEVTVDYLNDGTHDALLIVSDGSAMIADITEGAKPIMIHTLDRMAVRGVTEVDTLLLTHIHRRHVNAVRAVMSERIVHRLLIPEAADDYEKYIINDLIALAARFDTEVLRYSREDSTAITFENASVSMCAYAELRRSTHPLIALYVESGDARIAYAGVAAWENEEVWRFLDGADHLILGQNGPYYKTPPKSFPDGVQTYSAESETLAADISSIAGEKIRRIPDFSRRGILLKP